MEGNSRHLESRPKSSTAERSRHRDHSAPVHALFRRQAELSDLDSGPRGRSLTEQSDGATTRHRSASHEPTSRGTALHTTQHNHHTSSSKKQKAPFRHVEAFTAESLAAGHRQTNGHMSGKSTVKTKYDALQTYLANQRLRSSKWPEVPYYAIETVIYGTEDPSNLGAGDNIHSVKFCTGQKPEVWHHLRLSSK